jgi:simple sugar transport system substrate-binding protein
MVALGDQLVKGVKPADGMDIPGLGPVQLGPEDRTLRANKMLDINPDTIDELAKLI